MVLQRIPNNPLARHFRSGVIDAVLRLLIARFNSYRPYRQGIASHRDHAY